MTKTDAYNDKLLNEHLLDFDKEHEKTLEQERIEEKNDALLQSIDVPCQHCFEYNTANWDVLDNGCAAVICAGDSGCSSATGYFENRQEAVDLWCGRVAHHSSLRIKDAIVRQIDDLFEADDTVPTMEESEMLHRIIAMIWNNEINGIRFECGGADNRGKR